MRKVQRRLLSSFANRCSIGFRKRKFRLKNGKNKVVLKNVTAKNITKECFYVRCGTSSIVAKGDVLDELREMAGRVPFDERGNPDIRIEDISMVLLRDHLVKVGSRLAAELHKIPLAEILEQMELLTGPAENRMIKNVAAMMFCEDPSRFFPYTQVDVVYFPGGSIKEPDNFSEVSIKGSVPQMIKHTMDFLNTNHLKQRVCKVPGRQEANRFWNYPYDALEEAVVNSLYHRDYRLYEPVEITIEPDCINILNCPGPDRSISEEAIRKGDKLKSRRYRNRRLGDFLKELDLTEGRSTGVPTIQAKLAANGSPRASFETTNDRLTFLIHIPIHRAFGSENCGNECGVQLTERQCGILKILENDGTKVAGVIAGMIGLSKRTVEEELSFLRKNGFIDKQTKDNRSPWVVLKGKSEL